MKRTILICITIFSATLFASEAPRTVYAWYPRDMGKPWTTSAIQWKGLTHISYRSVELEPDGSIKPAATPAQVKALVDEAHSHGVKVTVLTWGKQPPGTSGAQAGAYSSQYLSKCPEKTVQALLDYVKANNLDGVNIDDETWNEKNTETGGSNRELVTKFFKLLNKEFKAARADYHLSWASPPVISSSDKYGEAWFDFPAIADLLDTINIMSYEISPAGIGWTGSKQPIGGGGKVGTHPRDYATILKDYIQATGKPEKLLIGIDNGRAGSEWDCKTDQPLSPTIGRARALKPAEAIANSEKHGRKFDAAQKAPWYCYASGDHFVQGWYEDDEAQAAKFTLARESKIGGVCIWVVDGAHEPPVTFKLGQEFLGGK